MKKTMIETVASYADNVLNCYRDEFGKEKTPLFIDAFNPVSGKSRLWHGRVTSNFALHQPFLRTLHALTELTGRRCYRDTADEWVEYAMTRLQDDISGLLYWGGHAFYDLDKKKPIFGCHEMKCVYPAYSAFYRVKPEETEILVEGFWERHIRDWSNLLFNRHGNYGGSRMKSGTGRVWDMDFKGGELPIIENVCLSFINTGSDLIMAAAELSRLSDTPKPLYWARNLLSRYDQIRHPDTQLGGYQFNHREPCRVRASFTEPLNRELNVNETSIIDCKVILMRYGRVAVTFMNLYEALGDSKGSFLLDFVRHDLEALASFAYDTCNNTFLPVFSDGRRIKRADCIEGAGYVKRRNLVPLPPNGIMFLAYAKAYRILQVSKFRDIALDLAGSMGWVVQNDEHKRYTVDIKKSNPLPNKILTNRTEDNLSDIACLMGWVELARANPENDFLKAAEGWAEKLLQKYFKDGFFFTEDINKISGNAEVFAHIGSSLPLALLHLATVRQGVSPESAPFYAASLDLNTAGTIK